MMTHHAMQMQEVWKQTHVLQLACRYKSQAAAAGVCCTLSCPHAVCSLPNAPCESHVVVLLVAHTGAALVLLLLQVSLMVWRRS